MVLNILTCRQNSFTEVLQLSLKTVFFEPTDRRKAIKPLHRVNQLAYSSPNISELRAMAENIKPNFVVDTSTKLKEIIELSKIVTQKVGLLIVTLGSKGVITIRRVHENGNNQLYVRLYHAEAIKNVENVSGAGDCFSSGFIHGTLLGVDEPSCISMGLEAAKHALLCKQTVPTQFNFPPHIKQPNFDAWKYNIH